jgi:hypothetical protein
MVEFWNRLEQALDLSKNVSVPAKNDLGNIPLSENIRLKLFVPHLIYIVF